MGINALSLFDGMSCGQIALERAGVKVENYFASEIDKFAIKVTQTNYPKTKQLGSVTELDGTKLPKIDLLFGGSPCQSFSTAGGRAGFNGKSKLFWEYVRILKEVKPTYFLLENVVMKKQWKQIITDALGVEPIFINSNLVCGANSPRLYWTNIPNVIQPNDTKIKLIDILENLDFDREPYVENYVSSRAVNYKTEKFNTLRASAGSRTQGIGICNNDGRWRKLTPIECERLQTVPDNYTNYVSDTQRYKMLGNGWTVDVIAHIFKGLPYRNL
jgi:site-specific DNA-cytosine methylase